MQRNTILPVILALLSAGTFATAAQADPTGLRATAIGGLERTDSASGSGASDGFYYGGQLGYDYDLGGLIAGVEAELGGSSARDTVAGVEARHGVFGNAAVRLAVPVTDGARVFARGGYAYHRIDYATGTDFSGSGYVLGGGGEVDLGSRLLLRGEYRFSDYGSQVRGQHFVVGLGLRF